jgi:hypothetical protein
MKNEHSSSRIFWGVSLIAAPLLQAISTFFWEGNFWEGNGQGITGGTLVVLSTIFWIPAFIGLFGLLRERMPRYATWGLLPAFYGCIGGALFGFRDIYAATFHIAHQTELQAISAYALSYNITLFWPGYCFVLSLLVLGFFLTWKKLVPWWIGTLFCLGALAFPVSRIPRIVLIAHVADVLLLIPLLFLGWTLLVSRPTGPQAGLPQTVQPQARVE